VIWPRRHVFGAAECPLMYRWHLVNLGDRGKVMLHWFLPGRSETDFHDHPRSFVTVVLWGGYDDVTPAGLVDHVRAPALRRRPAEHAHRTEAGPRGALTLCLLGPRRRIWGFYRRDSRSLTGLLWLPWRDHERLFGSTFRCE
jgi:hypothetical protein